jgi:hypothetical protein
VEILQEVGLGRAGARNQCGKLDQAQQAFPLPFT